MFMNMMLSRNKLECLTPADIKMGANRFSKGNAWKAPALLAE